MNDYLDDFDDIQFGLVIFDSNDGVDDIDDKYLDAHDDEDGNFDHVENDKSYAGIKCYHRSSLISILRPNDHL